MVAVPYSIVIPVYNEERRLPKNAETIFQFFAGVEGGAEIIFVNDGSTDGTAQLLGEYQKKYSCRVVSYAVNRGKGYAVRQGAFAATGQWVIFFDVDLATPLTVFNDLVGSLSASDAVVIGSRRMPTSQIKRAESRVRTLLGHSFTKISNLLVPGVTDFTCGFKCFSAAAAKIIFPRARIDRWGFDTELLYIARVHKLLVREIPVEWVHDTDSRVRVGQAIVSTLGELVRMAWYRVRGLYR